MSKAEIPIRDFPYLLHPYNATLVTCIGKDGKPNIIAIAWIIPVSINPPYLVMSIRPTRHSYKLIMETGEFVVNISPYKLVSKVIFCGRKSGRDYDKFKETGLTPMKAKKVSPPIIAECIAHIECKVAKTIEAGDHNLIIGEVLTAYASKEHFEKHYKLDKYNPLLHIRGNLFTTTINKMEEYKLK